MLFIYILLHGYEQDFDFATDLCHFKCLLNNLDNLDILNRISLCWKWFIIYTIGASGTNYWKLGVFY